MTIGKHRMKKGIICHAEFISASH